MGKTCDLAFGYQGGLNAWRKLEPDKFTDAEVETFKAEWRGAHPEVRFTPNSGHSGGELRCPLCANSRHQPSLLDHLVGTGEQRLRYFDAKRLSGFQVDNQSDLADCCDRQVGRLSPLRMRPV